MYHEVTTKYIHMTKRYIYVYMHYAYVSRGDYTTHAYD